MPDWSTMKLGKRPATIDRRTLRAEHYIDLSAVLPQVPDVIDWSTKVARFEMFLNDQIGDCVIAALAHQEEAVSAQNGRELVITDQDVLTGYEAVGGYVPGRPETDEGCDPLVALKWWRATGIAGNRIGAFVSVDPNNAQLVRAALYLFGGLFLGLALPVSAQTQSVWDVPAGGPTGPGAPGSWGGHMVYVVRQLSAAKPYDVVTWGMLQPMTQAFLATYSPQECYAVIPQAWLNNAGQAPVGLDLTQLTADLAIVSGAQPDPAPPQPTHFVPSGPTADAWALLQQGGALAKAELALLLSTDPTGPAAPAWRYLLNGGDVQALLDAWGPYLHAEGAA